MLDVYTPVSAQHKPIKEKGTELLTQDLLSIGYEEKDINIRSFNGGHYSGTKEIVKNPDLMVLLINHRGSRVGKGAISEIEYAQSRNIPVFVLGVDHYSLCLFQDSIGRDEDDWRNYALIKAEEISIERFIEILNNFGVLHNSGLIELTENVSKLKRSNRRLLLLN